MRLELLREAVCAANRKLPAAGLTILTWGNVSAFDPESGLVAIKPSGLPYESLGPEDMVLVNLDGEIIEGRWNPSSDTTTHLEMYRNFPMIGSIVHTHSPWATIWAQLGENIPPLGTTHADDFGEEILCTRKMTHEEIQVEYEKNTGKVIVETLKNRDLYKHYGVLVRSHGPFVWEQTPEKAVQKAIVLEQVAMMAWHCCLVDPQIKAVDSVLLHKHFNRKHGENAYYGQK